MSNPYGQDPYGQPNPPDPQQQHDLYGSMTGYTSAQSSASANDAHQQPQDPYGQANPYAQQQQPASSQATPANPYGAYSTPASTSTKKSSVLGVVALVLGLIGVLLSLIMAVVGGNAFTAIVEAVGTTDIPEVAPPGVEGDYAVFGVTFLVYLLTAIPIFAGLIMGIIAIATNRGRMPGVLATILTVLGPIIVFVVFFVIAGPAALENAPT